MLLIWILFCNTTLVELSNHPYIIFADSWGDIFPIHSPNWDLVIASDILLCKFWILQQFFR